MLQLPRVSLRMCARKVLRMPAIIESMLPPTLLTAIGTYMQTAAHIEWTMWQTLLLVDAGQRGREPKLHFKEILEAKKRSDALLKEYREVGKICAEPIGKRISTLADRVKAGLDVRNLVAHGAFLVNAGTGTVSVWRFPKKWLPGGEPLREEVITEAAIEEALLQIDEVLREALSIRELVAASFAP